MLDDKDAIPSPGSFGATLSLWRPLHNGRGDLEMSGSVVHSPLSGFWRAGDTL